MTTTVGGRLVVASPAIGVVVDGKDPGANASMGTPQIREIREIYPTLGIHAMATNAAVEASIPVAVQGGPAWTLEVRVYDDGVAYRYRVPGAGKRHVGREASEWRLSSGSRMWFQTHNNRKDYEAPWGTTTTGELLERLAPRPRAGSTQPLPPAPGTQPGQPPAIIAAPVLFQLAGEGGYVMITDANLVGYTDTALQYVGNDTFRAVFHNERDGFDADGEIVSSWRAAIITADLNALVNSDLVQNLCPPPPSELFADAASWIKPGRATWHWMVTGGPRLEQQRQWVDWTAAIGFEYYLIDDGWNRWRPTDGGDAWQAMKGVVAYAKTKNVQIWAWVDSKDLRDHASRAAYFAKAREAGVVGLKIDFMKPANVEWVTWYDQTIRQAAEHKLMLNFHGSLRPTGRQRTLPNDMTRESVRGREMGKQPPLHDAILPFVRMVQGPADYTPVDFRTDKLRGSTFAHELSTAVIFTSPFFCYGGAPEDYLKSEAADLIRGMPATWDETRVLPGSEVGELVAFARRKGDDWYIGVMNGAAVPAFAIDLSFLGGGDYAIDQFADSPDRNDAFVRTSGTVRAGDRLTVALRQHGGLVAKISRANRP